MNRKLSGGPPVNFFLAGAVLLALGLLGMGIFRLTASTFGRPPPSLTPVPVAMTSPTPQPSSTPTPSNVPIATSIPKPSPTVAFTLQANSPPTIIPTQSTSPPIATSGCTLFCQLLHELGDPSALPYNQGRIVSQVASQDQVYLEHYWDYFNSDELFLSRGFSIRQGYDGQKEYVVLPNTPGPGYIARIYFTNRQHNWALEEGDDPASPEATEWGFLHELGNIRIYFDDQPTPRIDMPATEFFRGDVSPFLAPLVGHYGTANGGDISYVPMPFAQSVLIATTGRPRLFEIEVVQFTQDPGPFASFDPNLSFAEAQELNRVISRWQSLGVYPYPTQTNLFTHSESLNIPGFTPGETRIPGPGLITSLRITLLPGDDENIRLKIFWDGEQSPSIDMPLRALFGSAEEIKYYQSLLLGISPGEKGNELYSYLPMPFSQEARIVLENGRPDALTGEIAIRYTPLAPSDSLLHFHAAFKQEPLEPRSDDAGNYILADLVGRGQFVGYILTMYDLDRNVEGLDPNWRFPYLESDVNIWIDGAYALPGTGIEGDFNAGYYYIYTGVPGRQWNFALSGNPWKDALDWGEVVSQYRFYLTDALEFNGSLHAEVEHGFKGNNLRVTYSSTIFWYQY